MQKYFLNRWRSIKFAINGCLYVFHTQPNTWIYTFLTLLVIFIAIFLQLKPFEWAILIVALGMVWTAEFINTAIERIVDLASPQEHPLAKLGKDISAAAVLISAICSVIVGICLLGPPLLDRMMGIFLK